MGKLDKLDTKKVAILTGLALAVAVVLYFLIK